MTNLMNLRMFYELKKITSEDYIEKLVERTAEVLEIEREFQILDFLGRGSYGVVLSAISPDYEEEIAVKFTRSEHTRDEEINIWPSLEHENILQVFEVNCLQHVTIFITPKMDKDFETSLAEDKVQKNPSGLDMVKAWLRQILAALDHLHSNQLCHMDIKGDNVLIDYDSTAKLCDFSFLQNAENVVIRCGAPLLYRPPQSENNSAINGYSFDMWCYGIMALNALTQYSMLKDISSLERSKFDWRKDVYPTLLKCLQLDNFRSLMSAAFPACALKESDFTEALDFIHFLLRVDPACRPSANEALNHLFLNEGKYIFEKPDDLWKNKVDEHPDLLNCCPYFEMKSTHRQRKRKLHRYKYKYNRIAKQKKKKWVKNPKTMTNLIFASPDSDSHFAVPFVAMRDRSNCNKERVCEANEYQELYYIKEGNEKTQKIVFSEEKVCGSNKIEKYIPDVNRDNDVIPGSDSEVKDQLCVNIKHSVEDNADQNGHLNQDLTDGHESKESSRKLGPIRKLCSWLQGKFRKICICGSGPVSEN